MVGKNNQDLRVENNMSTHTTDKKDTFMFNETLASRKKSLTSSLRRRGEEVVKYEKKKGSGWESTARAHKHANTLTFSKARNSPSDMPAACYPHI